MFFLGVSQGGRGAVFGGWWLGGAGGCRVGCLFQDASFLACLSSVPLSFCRDLLVIFFTHWGDLAMSFSEVRGASGWSRPMPSLLLGASLSISTPTPTADGSIGTKQAVCSRSYPKRGK